MSCENYKELIKGCEVPSKHTNNLYRKIIDDLKQTNVVDNKNVREALNELSKISVTDAFKEIRTLNSKSGGKRRKTKQHKRRGEKKRKTKKHKRSHRKGGTLSNKKKCYLKATGILISIIGSGVASAQMLILPSILSTLPTPCEGITDQTIGFLLGKVNPDYSCVARQQIIQTFVNNILSYIGKSIGMGTALAIFKPSTFLALMKSSKKFSSKIFTYLLHKVCPSDYEEPDFTDVSNEIKEAVRDDPITLSKDPASQPPIPQPPIPQPPPQQPSHQQPSHQQPSHQQPSHRFQSLEREHYNQQRQQQQQQQRGYLDEDGYPYEDY